MLAFLTAFNWTKVELKPDDCTFVDDVVGAFNWTKVELKHMWRKGKTEGKEAFNWTKVELKHYYSNIFTKAALLLIELR